MEYVNLYRSASSQISLLRQPVVQRFLDGHGLGVRDVDGWVVHPGGPKVLDAVAETLRLPPDALDASRAVLAGFGNASAAGVLMVLRRMLESGARGRHPMLALGPGFTAAVNMLEL